MENLLNDLLAAKSHLRDAQTNYNAAKDKFDKALKFYLAKADEFNAEAQPQPSSV